MIIEKTTTENSYNINTNNYAAEGELTVTITLGEYRSLIKESAESKVRKEHENWLEQYDRANKAESRVKELENELNTMYKRISKSSDEEESEQE